MPTESGKPLIVISYAHADEPEHPAEGEVKWLSFVTGYLRPAIKHGAVDLWIDRLMPGGAEWEREIGEKLRACDVFVLLVSPYSLSSDYIVDKEIAIIRERQAKGEDVHFYPLLLTPTPKLALDLVCDKNLRPRDAKPLFDYSINERYRHMSEAADEIAEIAAEIAGQKRIAAAALPSPRPAVLPIEGRQKAESWIRDRTSLEAWLKGQSAEVSIANRETLESWLISRNGQVAVAIAARAALRTLPLSMRRPSGSEERQLAIWISALFRASASAWCRAKYPSRADELVGNASAAAAAVVAHAAVAAACRAAANAAAASTDADTRVAAVLAVARSTDAVYNTVEYGLRNAALTPAAAAAADASPKQAASEVWQTISTDAEIILASEVSVAIDSPVWPNEVPGWASAEWATLQAILPPREDWDVWIDWYEDRLRGGSRGEAYELVFASVPADVWAEGPAAANAWIREHLPKPSEAAQSAELPEPVASVESPWTYSWTAKATITIAAGPESFPFYSFFNGEQEHRQTLEVCRVGAEKLLKKLQNRRYDNVRQEYRERLEDYLQNLPRTTAAGNILLAYDETLDLRSDFAAETDTLPIPFATELRRVIENQFALNTFYDIVARHNEAIALAKRSAPYPSEAVGPLNEFISANTPRLFEPNVFEAQRRLERAGPPDDQRTPPASTLEGNSSIVQPSPLPPATPDATRAHQRQTAANANALWDSFVKGPVVIEGGLHLAQELGNLVRPFLEYLRS